MNENLNTKNLSELRNMFQDFAKRQEALKSTAAEIEGIKERLIYLIQCDDVYEDLIEEIVEQLNEYIDSKSTYLDLINMGKIHCMERL